ncbi:hypothetical protein [Actinomadura madurae]|uniref:hypothetical protein n=1 Tax=Actinomadura madurae TaxID=1993 RepID=UPI003557FDAA
MHRPPRAGGEPGGELGRLVLGAQLVGGGEQHDEAGQVAGVQHALPRFEQLAGPLPVHVRHAPGDLAAQREVRRRQADAGRLGDDAGRGAVDQGLGEERRSGRDRAPSRGASA